MAQQTSIHIVACNIGSSERHNLRSKELDYIRPELSHLNESWVGQEIAPCLKEIKNRYKETTGQTMQKKATPIREGVAVIDQGTTMEQLQDFADKLQERWGIKTIQIHTHKDEGHTPIDKPGEWKPNLHAHLIFNWTDDTGKSFKLKKQDMCEMQTMLAECLSMERGVSSDRKHLNSIQYKVKKGTEDVLALASQVERAREIAAELPEMEQVYKDTLEQYEEARIKLDQVAQKLQDLNGDIRSAELKKSATKAGKAIFSAIERTFSSRKVESMQEEIKALKSENKSIKQRTAVQLDTAKGNITRLMQEKERSESELKGELKAIQQYFPTLENANSNIKQLRQMGINDAYIPRLLVGQELKYSGELNDTEHNCKHQVRDVSVQIGRSNKGGMFVWLNGQTPAAFFQKLWQAIKQTFSQEKKNSVEPDIKQQKRGGFHL